jgi:hypothetical protein
MAGQVNPDSAFGNSIIEIASESDYTSFLDVGTWNGQGTTQCLYDAVGKREGVHIYSVESNAAMYEKAVAFWAPCPPSLHLLYGTLSKGGLTEAEIRAHPLFNDVKVHFNLHYEQDCKDLEAAPIVELVARIDMVILGGGEFCGAADFKRAALLNPKVIALDDIRVMKNRENYERLLADSEWELVARGKDRNGWAIFRRTS